jgi:hypothetical protein
MRAMAVGVGNNHNSYTINQDGHRNAAFIAYSHRDKVFIQKLYDCKTNAYRSGITVVNRDFHELL